MMENSTGLTLLSRDTEKLWFEKLKSTLDKVIKVDLELPKKLKNEILEISHSLWIIIEKNLHSKKVRLDVKLKSGYDKIKCEDVSIILWKSNDLLIELLWTDDKEDVEYYLEEANENVEKYKEWSSKYKWKINTDITDEEKKENPKVVNTSTRELYLESIRYRNKQKVILENIILVEEVIKEINYFRNELVKITAELVWEISEIKINKPKKIDVIPLKEEKIVSSEQIDIDVLKLGDIIINTDKQLNTNILDKEGQEKYNIILEKKIKWTIRKSEETIFLLENINDIDQLKKFYKKDKINFWYRIKKDDKKYFELYYNALFRLKDESEDFSVMLNYLNSIINDLSWLSESSKEENEVIASEEEINIEESVKEDIKKIEKIVPRKPKIIVIKKDEPVEKRPVKNVIKVKRAYKKTPKKLVKKVWDEELSRGYEVTLSFYLNKLKKEWVFTDTFTKYISENYDNKVFIYEFWKIIKDWFKNIDLKNELIKHNFEFLIKKLKI